jgi:hypothetical protein
MLIIGCDYHPAFQQIARVPLLPDMSQSPPLPARIFQRHQSQITRDLLATLKPICFPDNQHERRCGQWP